MDEQTPRQTWRSCLVQRHLPALLNCLKKRSDKSYGQMLDNPETHPPQELLSHQGKWSNLKDQQKAVVQLLIGQQKLDDNNQLILLKIQQLLDLFDYQPELDSPEFLLQAFDNAPPASARWLNYSSRQSTFLGRDAELQMLLDFLASDAMFSWFCVTGAGGTGKSRLGLELMLATPWYWERGLLRSNALQQFKVNDWKPAHPTLLVVDYGAEVSTELKSLVDKLLRRQNNYDYPVRLLILERHYKEQAWWNTLYTEGKDALIRQQSFFASEPVELSPISNEQQAILSSYLETLDFEDSLAEENPEFWHEIDLLSEGGKPLFLGMIAIAIKDEGLNQIRGWKRHELLNHLLVREQRSWQSQLAEFNGDTQQHIIEVMLFSTVIQGVDLKQDKDRFRSAVEASGILSDLTQLPKHWKKVQQLTGQGNGVLLPDIFAEFVLAHYWQFEQNGFNEEKHNKLEAAFRFSPQQSMQVISRCATDFDNSL